MEPNINDNKDKENFTKEEDKLKGKRMKRSEE
jgi:hypothetical protein